ncbi:MAG TPA: PilZ domain-containing protein [bacterium]|nr:PilZ domain-containing protein [bacterium]HXC65742.1 PilZ domain-containing protein [bacterium]
MNTEIHALAAVVPLALEQRHYERHNLCFSVKFEVIAEPAPEAAPRRPAGHAAQGPAREPFDPSVYTRSISGGGLGMQGPLEEMSKRDFSTGDRLLIRIGIPHSDETLRCLGKVVWKDVDQASGLFHAGVEFVAVNKGDLDDVISRHPAAA